MQTKSRLMAGLAVLGVATGAVLFRVARFDRPSPAPVVSADELPALPAPQDNGWLEVADLEVPGGAACEESSFIVLASGELGSADDDWRRLEDAETMLSACAGSPESVNALSRWRQATTAPHFVPYGDGRKIFSSYKFQSIVRVAVANHALQGRLAEADELLAGLARAQLSSFNTSRNTFVAMSASAALRDTLWLAHVVSQHHGWRGLPRLAAAVRQLQRELASFEHVLGQARLGEYLATRERIEAGAANLGWTERWFYDKAHTARLVDTAFVEFRRARGAELLALPGDDELDAHCGWIEHLYNSLGCDAYDPDQIAQTYENTEKSLASSDEVNRRRLRRLSDSLTPI